MHHFFLRSRSRTRVASWTLCVAGVVAACAAQHPAPAPPPAPSASAEIPPPATGNPGAGAFAEPVSLAPRQWWVLGPLPDDPASGDSRRMGLERNYLQGLGGEDSAVLAEKTELYLGEKLFKARHVEANEAGGVDFVEVFGRETDFRVAYAYAEFDAAETGVHYALFGSDDGAKVWVNSRLVHQMAVDRALNPDSDRFEFPLAAGKNRVLIKVDNGAGGWGFALRLFDARGFAQLRLREQRSDLEGLFPAPDNDSYLLGDEFPKLYFQRHAANLVFSEDEPRIQWFGPDLIEAQRPVAPGRYFALIEAKTRDGDVHRRLATFAKPDAKAGFSAHMDPWASLGVPPFGDPKEELGVVRDVPLNAEQKRELSRQILAGGGDALQHGPLAALTIARLHELGQAQSTRDAEPAWLGGSFIRNAEHQLALRMKIERRTPRPLAPPIELKRSAGALRKGNELAAGMKPGSVLRIRNLAREWAKEDPNGFVVLIARRGVIVLHEGFNGFEPGTRFHPASIGKTIGALLFARAVDQGLLGFDQKVAEVFPDFAGEQTREITFPNLYNHVAGLRGHASHHGLFNAYLDNALALQDLEFAKPRQRFQYNGDDHNLAGKALELTTGTSIFRLLHDHLQRPFDPSVTQFDLGFGDEFTALYLAQVGQMLLQDGAYGDHRFYSPGFVKQLWPRPIRESVPGFTEDQEWGIGFEWMIDPNGPRERAALGPNVIGHGAASGTVWRIAPDHDLVIVVGRDRFAGTWGDNDHRIDRFVAGVAETLG